MSAAPFFQHSLFLFDLGPRTILGMQVSRGKICHFPVNPKRVAKYKSRKTGGQALSNCYPENSRRRTSPRSLTTCVKGATRSVSDRTPGAAHRSNQHRRSPYIARDAVPGHTTSTQKFAGVAAGDSTCFQQHRHTLSM